MATYDYEGVGATIEFLTTGIVADLISFTLVTRSRSVLDTSGISDSVVKSNKPAKLLEPGTMALVMDFNPSGTPLVTQDPERIKVTFPLLEGETTPAQWEFTGYATEEGGGEMGIDAVTRSNVTLQLQSDIDITTPT